MWRERREARGLRTWAEESGWDGIAEVRGACEQWGVLVLEASGRMRVRGVFFVEEMPSGNQAHRGPKLWSLADFGTRFGKGNTASIP